ncbi:nuclear transport factor 2 family protein [Mesorhizobium sp. CA8]|uniref:nuclear transport factor 2 family protein n=1 Tax=Mesorhizobium sp. CA8 TaxID=2876637 RepID=UPI00398F829D
MQRSWWRILLAAVLLLSVTVRASADDGAIIDRWYSALLVADRTELSDLLSDDVRMKLEDMGIVQTKQDFIASIDEWQSAVAGAAIRHRIEKSDNGETTVLACYDFPSNDTLMRETFTVSGGRIVASTQTAVAQDCSAY